MAATAEHDTSALQRAVRALAARTHFPVAFGGFVNDDVIRVDAIHGARTRHLEGLAVRPHRGLGGQAMTQHRPRMTTDYARSRRITHDYDAHILGEGLETLVAVPVVLHGDTHAVLYGGVWTDAFVGDVAADAAFDVAADFAQQLKTAPASEPAAPRLDTAQIEEVRASYAQLRAIAADVQDPDLRLRLETVQTRLAALTGANASPSRTEPAVRLSPRERDALACAATGATNAQIAVTLGLREATVKAYLGSAMTKLGVGTRYAAVAAARRAGLLP